MRLFSTAVAALFGLFLLSGVLPAVERPRLIVVISVDQLCQDYLIRFGDNFAADGIFRRVEREGASYAQCHHRHAFTVTGPGHAVQLTARIRISTALSAITGSIDSRVRRFIAAAIQACN